MEIIIQGGAGQLGGNCIELINNKTRVIIDLGVPITNIDGTEFEEPMSLEGEDLLEKGILPDIKGIYEWDKPEVTGILLSHYHGDHYGWVKYVHRDIPVYVGEISHRLIEVMKILNKDMDHSACDSYMFVLEGEDKRIVYTGDFRSHGRQENSSKVSLTSAIFLLTS